MFLPLRRRVLCRTMPLAAGDGHHKMVFLTARESPGIMFLADHNYSTSLSFKGTRARLRNPRLRAAFGIGFCILFAFIGTFTYARLIIVKTHSLTFQPTVAAEL